MLYPYSYVTLLVLVGKLAYKSIGLAVCNCCSKCQVVIERIEFRGIVQLVVQQWWGRTERASWKVLNVAQFESGANLVASTILFSDRLFTYTCILIFKVLIECTCETRLFLIVKTEHHFKEWRSFKRFCMHKQVVHDTPYKVPKLRFIEGSCYG